MKNKISRRRFLKHSLQGTALFVPGTVNLLLQGCARQKDYDLLITGGVVYDGLGNPGREIDIAIKGDKIFLLGKNLDKRKSKTVIEAGGAAVAPGFIDAHSHTDLGLIVNPKAESQVRQGVTTEISGNCGYSPFPFSGITFEEMKASAQKEFGMEPDWKDIAGFFARLKKSGTAINYATLLGHGTLRGSVVGLDDRPPTEAQLNRMIQLVEENIEAGALGISTGLVYAPGSYAQTPEILALCQAAARKNGVYATHMRSEDDFVLEAIDETIDIARKSGVSVQISHLKVAYQKNFPKIDEVLAKIEAAKNQGIDILADRYPYTAGSAGLTYFFPLWALQGPTKDFIARLKNPETDAKIRRYLKEQEEKLGSWEKVVISSVVTEKNKKFEGKSVLEGAALGGKKPYDFMKDLLIEEEGHVLMIAFFTAEENLKRILAHPLVVIGADGAAVAPYGVLGKGKSHPRLYGTFPRVLGKYAGQEKCFSLARGIQKMTSMTAQKFGLRGRGEIKEGYFADLAIFEPGEIMDRATYSDPHQYPRGINHVIVNGRQVIRNGEHTGALPGNILKG